jgi:hypothetical protein
MTNIPCSFNVISTMEAAWTLLDAMDEKYPDGWLPNQALDILADAKARRDRERERWEVIHGR